MTTEEKVERLSEEFEYLKTKIRLLPSEESYHDLTTRMRDLEKFRSFVVQPAKIVLFGFLLYLVSVGFSEVFIK